MPAIESDDSREERIELEIVVDAYNEAERAMGWYYYLDNPTSHLRLCGLPRDVPLL